VQPNVPQPRDILIEAIQVWVDDPESDVVYAEEVEDRWATRMRQECREATTVWWHVGQRTLTAEAYVLPAPITNHADVYRLCLKRNAAVLRAHFALDAEEAVVLRARIPLELVSAEVLDQVLAEIYQQVELSFRPLARLAFSQPNAQS
jgi:hypothetical protein